MKKKHHFLNNPYINSVEGFFFWIILIVGTILILKASADYAIPGRTHDFIAERPSLANTTWWRWTLYIHVAGGLLCLVSSLLQYSKTLLTEAPKIHSQLGKVYAYSILALVFPSGVALSFVAKGGIIGMVGFLLLSFSTLFTLLMGLSAIKKRDISLHRAWITRSFALITTAISFRTIQLILIQLNVEPHFTYQLSLWLSILLNVILAEYYIFKQKLA